MVLTPASPGAVPAQPIGNPVGDGIEASVNGYRMTDVTLPPASGVGEVSFRLLTPTGEPLMDYTEEQTKLLHLYVVRDDLAQFRHLHPTLAEDGTWTARVDLGSPGRWRVVAEFIPAGSSTPIVLGTTLRVRGSWTPEEVPGGEAARSGSDGVVRARLLADGQVGPNGRLRLRITDADGNPLTLGSYLGTTGHLTGFAVGTRGFVHVHPYGAPEVSAKGTVLTFHTVFTEPGDYRLFLQVRVDGLLHQVAITAPVSPAA